MAKLDALPEQAIIDGYRGILDFYYWKCIPVVRSWPRSPTGARTPEVQAQWSAWSYASRLWLQLSDEVRRAYNVMAIGSGLTGRDVMMRGYLSGLYRNPQP